ncbi:MAG: hypothetical protein HY925_10815 [Elusimicrobia bacterium]|nr:hypothetical protein [Elusimicrobiota bacterium]
MPISARRLLILGALLTTTSTPLLAADAFECPKASYVPSFCAANDIVLETWNEFHTSFDGFTVRMHANASMLASKLESQRAEARNNTYNSVAQKNITAGQLFPVAGPCDENTGVCPDAPDPVLTPAQAQKFNSCFARVDRIGGRLLTNSCTINGQWSATFDCMRGYYTNGKRSASDDTRARGTCNPYYRPWDSYDKYKKGISCANDLKGMIDQEAVIIDQSKEMAEYPAECDEPVFGDLANYERNNQKHVLSFLGDSACSKNPTECAPPWSAGQAAALRKMMDDLKSLFACESIKKRLGDRMIDYKYRKNDKDGFIETASGNGDMGTFNNLRAAFQRFDAIAEGTLTRTVADAPNIPDETRLPPKASVEFVKAYRYMIEASMQAYVIEAGLRYRKTLSRCP